MSQTVSRRSVTSGVAWSVPAVAVAAAAPAFAASLTCRLTKDDLNAGKCSAESMGVVGSRTYSTTGGGLINATTANNFALKSPCDYGGPQGLVNAYFYSEGNPISRTVAKPTLMLPDGTTYQGYTTLGDIGGGGAKVGFDMSVSILWDNSKGSYSKNWAGAKVSIPFAFHYTAPNGSLHRCNYQLTYTMPKTYSIGLEKMDNPQISIYS